MTDGASAYGGDEEVLEVVRRFESCEYAPDDFKHGPHLTVALLYLLEAPYPAALERMRRGLRHFTGRHGLPGVYHETLTVFWMRRVRAFLEGERNEARSLVSLANELAATADKRLPLEHYTRERLFSPEARAAWVEPDLKPL